MAAWLEEVHDDVLRRIFEFGALVEWQRALQSSWRLWVNTWAYLRRLEELSLTTSDDLRRAGALERVGGLVALERLRVVEVEHCAEAESVLCGFDHLRSLELKECHFLSDAVLETIFRNDLQLHSLDVSWSSCFSDQPWALAPQSLQSFAGVGCEHLTERVVVHLSRRCPDLQVLHCSRHLNWIGSTRSEFLQALREMQNLKDLAFADVPLDDELLVALSAKPLVSLELWSFHGDRWMTSEGVVELARASLRDLRKLSLDSFVFQNSEVLQSLSSHCEALQELLLEGTIPCCIGPICGTLRWANLEKLRLASCGLSGKLNCSQLPKLRYLWLFENSGLTSIQGCGQQMVALNLGLTSCTEIQDFRLDVLTMLDVSSLMLSDAQLAELLGPCARSVRRAVLGGNRISDDVLLDFLRSARDLHSLSLVGALGDGWGCLNALVEESVDALAPKLELLELSEQSCTGLASAFSVESSPTGSTFLQRSTGRVRATPAARGRRVRLWIVTSGEHLSPYGRMERMDDSWLPAMR